jgi:hypothetical protein
VRQRIVIIGGGFVGQLLHTVFPYARVLDWAPAPPPSLSRNIGPQYLWEPIPGLTCNKFTVTTHVDGKPATNESILAYKRKVGKDQDNGDWRAQFQAEMDGYNVVLPPSRVEYGMRVIAINKMSRELQMADVKMHQRIPYDILISTIPLYAILSLAGLPGATSLRYAPIFVSQMKIVERRPSPNMYVNYISDPDNSNYRTTFRDGVSYSESLISNGGFRFTPGKIYPNTQVADMLAQLLRYRIKTFGRFASWNPDELAHETYKQAVAFKEQHGL